jgi:hypothetical protein
MESDYKFFGIGAAILIHVLTLVLVIKSAQGPARTQ